MQLIYSEETTLNSTHDKYLLALKHNYIEKCSQSLLLVNETGPAD